MHLNLITDTSILRTPLYYGHCTCSQRSWNSFSPLCRGSLWGICFGNPLGNVSTHTVDKRTIRQQSVSWREIHPSGILLVHSPFPPFFLHLDSPTQWIIPAPKTDMSLWRGIHIVPTWTLSSEEPSVSVPTSLDCTCRSVLLKLQLCVFLDKKMCLCTQQFMNHLLLNIT